MKYLYMTKKLCQLYTTYRYNYNAYLYIANQFKTPAEYLFD